MVGRRQAVELASGKERGGGHDELANGVHIAGKGAGRDGCCDLRGKGAGHDGCYEEWRFEA
jgi:hypothetical protein